MDNSMALGLRSCFNGLVLSLVIAVPAFGMDEFFPDPFHLLDEAISGESMGVVEFDRSVEEQEAQEVVDRGVVIERYEFADNENESGLEEPVDRSDDQADLEDAPNVENNVSENAVSCAEVSEVSSTDENEAASADADEEDSDEDFTCIMLDDIKERLDQSLTTPSFFSRPWVRYVMYGSIPCIGLVGCIVYFLQPKETSADTEHFSS